MIIAQVAATLAELFPGRLRLALGSGEALYERVLGEPWPPASERYARLLERVDILWAPWAGRTVTHYVSILIEEGRLYTRPEVP
jgi:alkanesulfonate monooxygenase SsuD/methylene tetrahydromethanopterin reductase-like flavin-dependent oxidoreductase (luciferase family)